MSEPLLSDRQAEMRERNRRGTPMRRLTLMQEREAAKAYRQGATIRELAAQYGLSCSGMRVVVARCGSCR